MMLEPSEPAMMPDATTWPTHCPRCRGAISILLLDGESVMCDHPRSTRTGEGWKVRPHVCDDPNARPVLSIQESETGFEVATATDPDSLREKVRELASSGLAGQFTVKSIGRWGSVEIRSDRTYVITGPGFTEGPGYVIV